MFERFDLSNEKRIFGLDVMRAIAILIVLIGHANELLLPFAKTRIAGPLTIERLISIPFTFVDGVDVFFALSGFLIGGILLKQFSRGPFGMKDLLHFWYRRWLRTIPAYVVVLVLNLVLLFTILPDEKVVRSDLPRYFFFLQNLFSDRLQFFTESWSLSVEEWFYLTFPFLATLLGKLAPKPARTRVFVVACALYIAIIVLSRAGWSLHHIAESETASWAELRRITVMRLDAILWGVIFAAFRTFSPDTFEKKRWHFAALGVALVLGSPLPGYAIHGAHEKPYMFVCYYTLLSAGYACFLPLAFAAKKAKRKAGSALTFISVTSYSLYLVNCSIVLHLVQKFVPIGSLTTALVVYVVYVLVSIVAGALFYLAVEKPVLAYRERVVADT